MQTIYLVRHGEIERGNPRQFIGQTDRSLTHKGEYQITQLGKHLQKHSIHKIFHSPLSRCRQSANILSTHLGTPVVEQPSLIEISLGYWEQLTLEDIKNRFPGSYEKRGEDFVGYRPPAGENFQDLSNRVWPSFQEMIRQNSKDLIIVAHAGVNRVIIVNILGISLKNIFKIRQNYGCMNIIQVTKNGFQIKNINQCIN